MSVLRRASVALIVALVQRVCPVHQVRKKEERGKGRRGEESEGRVRGEKHRGRE